MIDNLNTYRKYDLISCPEPETEDNNLNDVDYRWNNFTLENYQDHFHNISDDEIIKTIKNHPHSFSVYPVKINGEYDMCPPNVETCPICKSDPMINPCEHEW